MQNKTWHFHAVFLKSKVDTRFLLSMLLYADKVPKVLAITLKEGKADVSKKMPFYKDVM